MPSNTTKLGLRKINPSTDGNLNVNVDTDFNDNWDKIDAFADQKSNEIGNLPSLPTVNKSSVVAAITEIWNYPVSNMARQAIINGNFDVWQRGTSFTNPVTNAYTADRWQIQYDGSGMIHSVSQQAFTVGQSAVPNNPKYFLRRQVTTAGTGQTFNNFRQNIEDVQTFAGQKITLSFWAKAGAAITIGAIIEQNFGGGGSASVYTSEQNINLTTAWQKFSLTFTLASLSGKTIGTNSLLGIVWGLPLNATITFDIAQVQVNAGDQALPFIPRSLGEELALCQRYFQKSFTYDTTPADAIINGMIQWQNASASAQPMTTIFLKSHMRVVPTLTFYNPFAVDPTKKLMNTTTATSVAAGFNARSTSSFIVTAPVGSGAVGDFFTVHYTADAEL